MRLWPFAQSDHTRCEAEGPGSAAQMVNSDVRSINQLDMDQKLVLTELAWQELVTSAIAIFS